MNQKLLTIKSILDNCDDIEHLLCDLQNDDKESGLLTSFREHNYYVSTIGSVYKSKIEGQS